MIILAGVIGILVLLGILVFFAWQIQRSRQLRGGGLRRIQDGWRHVESIADPALQIMEADKVLDTALKALGFEGSLSDKLKKAGPRFSDLNALWSAHKLRNTLAHEMRASLSPGDASRAMKAFRKALADLGMR